MGALTTAYLIPNLIFSLHAGAWVDRRGRRRNVMLATDIGRALLIGSIPIAYAFGHLTWTQLYVVAFLTGSLSVFFYVAYGAMIQMLVPREDYVQANSLVHGSRAFSFLAGNSVGGVLVQLLRGPYALAADAVLVPLVGALSPDGCGSMNRPAHRPKRGSDSGRTLDPCERSHPGRAARSRDAQLLQLHLLRAVRPLCDAPLARLARCARPRSRRGLGRDARRVVRDRPHRPPHRRRANVRARLLPLSRAADPRPARRRPPLAGPRAAVRLRVPLGHRPDAARHHGRARSARA